MQRLAVASRHRGRTPRARCSVCLRGHRRRDDLMCIECWITVPQATQRAYVRAMNASLVTPQHPTSDVRRLRDEVMRVAYTARCA